MGTRENKVERHLDAEVKKRGGLTRKWLSPGRDGVPDRIVIHNGISYYVEVKTDDGKMSDCQSREHKRLADAGAQVFTVFGIDGVDCWVRDHIGEISDE